MASAPAASSPSDSAAREAIRALHARFLRHVSTGEHAAAAALFAPDAHLELGAPAVRGADAIRQFLGSDDVAARHGAYRVPAANAMDAITVAQMARLQGNVESRQWQPGRFHARYAKLRDGWRIADLRWSAT